MAKKALLVGVSDYVYCSKLPTCDRDAQDLKGVLTTVPEYEWSASNIVVMTSADGGRRHPSRGKIEWQLRQLCRSASPDDTILFFFSGHGAGISGEQYLCPIDANPNDVHTCVPLSIVKKELSESQARVRLVWLDACHSGEDAGRIKGPFAHLNTQQIAEELAATSGSVVFASCKPDEYSYAPLKWRNSLWATELIAALRNPKPLLQDGLLFHSDLATAVSQRVREFSIKHPTICDSVQTPVVYSVSAGGSIVLGNFRPALNNHDDPERLLKSAEIVIRETRTMDPKRILGQENRSWDPAELNDDARMK